MKRIGHGVKYREGEFYLRCSDCWARHQGSAYWPMTLDFWSPEQGLNRCRACWSIHKRVRRKRHDPRRTADYYRTARDVILFKKRVHYHENRERQCAAKRERYAAQRAAQGKPYTPKVAA